MPRKPIAVALGDIHLDHKIWTNINGVTGDAIVGYQAFLLVARRLGVPAVIVGDLFDMSKPTPDLIHAHREAMDFCAKEGVPVFVLQGNHDKQKTPWATATHEHPKYIGDGKAFSLGGLSCIAYDYASMDVIEPLIRKAEVHFLFLHQAVKQALGFENAWNADLDWVNDFVKLTVIGDIHKPMDFTLKNGNKACYTGPGHPRDIDQVGPKSVVVIYDDFSYEREPIPSRAIKKFQVRNEQDVAAVEAWLNKVETVHGLLPFAWVLHTPETFSKIHALQKEFLLASKAIIYREPLVEDDDDEAANPNLIIDDDISPTRLLAKIVDPEKDKELFSFVAELIDERNSVTEVINTRKPC